MQQPPKFMNFFWKNIGNSALKSCGAKGGIFKLVEFFSMSILIIVY